MKELVLLLMIFFSFRYHASEKILFDVDTNLVPL